VSVYSPAVRPVPNYTAWWQRHMGVNNLPGVVTCSLAKLNNHFISIQRVQTLPHLWAQTTDFLWQVLMNDHTDLLTCHPVLHKWNEPYLHLLQNITAFWPVLTSHPTEGRRLSGSGWLLHTEVVGLPKDRVTHPSNNWTWCRVTLLMYAAPLPLCSMRLAQSYVLVMYKQFIFPLLLLLQK